MKKNFLKSTIVVVAVAASSLGAWRAYNAYEVTDNTLLTENIEALANGSDNDSWAECPQDKWIRNAKESWKEVTPTYDKEIGFYVTIPFTNTKVGFGAGANASVTVLIPVCVTSNDNCCEKTHRNKSPRLL